MSEENIVSPKVNTAAPAPALTDTPAQTATETTPSSTPAETKTTGPNVDTLIPSDPYYMDPLFYEVASYFGVQQEEYASAKYKLSEIVDYVIKDAKSNKPEDVLTGLRKLEERVQPPHWDEKRYTNIYKYVRLAAKDQSIRQAMSAFEKGAKT